MSGERQKRLYPPGIMRNVADNIWLFRVFRGKTYQALASTEMDAQTLQTYERSPDKIPYDAVPDLARLLRVPERVVLQPAKFYLLMDADMRRKIEEILVKPDAP